MSESNITTDATNEAPTTAVDQPDEATNPAEETPVDQEATEDANGSREAAKWRRKLRDAEKERDQLRDQLDTMRRAEIDRTLKNGKMQIGSAAIFASGTDLSELLTDDGAVDSALVMEAAEKAGAALGIRVKLPAAPPATGQGRVGQVVASSGTSWSDVLKAGS